MTTVWACEKTVVIVKQPGHFTSIKKERGAGTRVCVCMWARLAQSCEKKIIKGWEDDMNAGRVGGGGGNSIYSNVP